MNEVRSTLRREDLPLFERLRLPLLTAEELAVHLLVPNARWVHEMARRREVPLVRVGGRHMFRLDAVVEVLWANRVTPMSEAEIRARIAAVAPSRRVRRQQPPSTKEDRA